MADSWFRIGNLDRLLVLPPPDSVKVVPVRAGATLTSLRGRKTVQTYGYAQAGEFEFRYITADELADLESIYLGNVAQPVHFFDPMRRNLLPRAISGPNSITEGEGYTGMSSVEVLSVASADPRTHPVPRCTTAVYCRTSAGTYIRRNDPDHLGEPFIPGSPLTLSIWVRVDAGSCSAYLQFRDRDGNDLGTRVDSPSSTGTGWQRLTVTVTTPPTNAVYVETGLVCFAALELLVGASQLEHGTQATDWVPGYGTPRVTVADLDHTSPTFGYYNVTATIVET